MLKTIQTALISVYYKDRLDEIAKILAASGVKIFSTGGTYDYIADFGISVEKVEDLTGYPSILGGRVKTLHPKVFGGILGRSDKATDRDEMKEYDIPAFDLVIVDLYPFEETLRQSTDQNAIIEKIDIGGISLIRAGGKNYAEVCIVPSVEHYDELIEILQRGAITTLEERRRFAGYAFAVSSHYDAAISNWFNGDDNGLRLSKNGHSPLRYGENPHQRGVFYGQMEEVFEKLHGKELSYNNLLDLDAGLHLLAEFEEPTIAILKHNNACGLASRYLLSEAWEAALAGDPVSAFGGIIVTNRKVDYATAQQINELFFEAIIAPDFEESAFRTLSSRKNRIILQLRSGVFPKTQYKSILNGILAQERDQQTEGPEDMKTVTAKVPSAAELEDLVFANKIVKHTRSNAIVLAKDKQLIGSGIGQTSRVDALKQAIAKAKEFGFRLNGAVMASDAFFPFADSVEIASREGVAAVVQPGGSVRDNETLDFCNKAGMSMVFTGVRHFKH
ncbi:bifunctional phosphoribosylaminoimidazolecarboxamide formyltransferase/IMP cyclohydrolase [Bacteroidales bacterium]